MQKCKIIAKTLEINSSHSLEKEKYMKIKSKNSFDKYFFNMQSCIVALLHITIEGIDKYKVYII